MIHEARQTAKFVKLVRKLRQCFASDTIDVETVATGLLERMWHFTLLSAKRGDIGQHDDELIAEAVGWYGTPSDLIEMFVEAGWLDRDDRHRLLVHDWHDHCPGHLKRNIGKIGGFVTHRKPELPASVDAGSGSLPPPDTQEAPTPNLTKPNLTIAPALTAAEFETTQEGVAYGVVAPMVRSVLRDLGGKDRKEDRRMILALMAMELCRWLPVGTMESLVSRTREKRPDNYYAWLKKLAKGRCDAVDIDLNEVLDGMQIEDRLLSLPPSSELTALPAPGEVNDGVD